MSADRTRRIEHLCAALSLDADTLRGAKEIGGAAIDALPLSSFVGPAWVVEVPRVDFILPEHLRGVDLERFPRVLFKTRSSAVPDDVWSAALHSVGVDPAALPSWTPERGGETTN